MEEDFNPDQNNSSYTKSNIGLQENNKFSRKSRPIIEIDDSILTHTVGRPNHSSISLNTVDGGYNQSRIQYIDRDMDDEYELPGYLD
mmetsp:Transcript_18438/g.16299  ORF Transcript_18438/g.16299 Transcript_18438/m.16299 type:complete len:87 (+) Transcript_18438:10-270(+)